VLSLAPKTPSETRTYVFEFLSLLGAGETIGGATLRATVWSGTDANPSAILGVGTTISGTKVTVVLTGGIEGVIYQVTVLGTTSLSQSVSLQALLAIVKNPA
jgi:hypothetical protein